MKLAYAIMTIDDSRAERKKAIRNIVELPECTDVPWVDGRRKVVAWRELKKRPWISVRGRFTWGEIGVWLSTITAWEYLVESDLEALLVFEDDAIVELNFNERLKEYIDDLPEDWDALALFVPQNQRGDYYYNVIYDEHGNPKSYRRGNKRFHESNYRIGDGPLSRSYQGYSGVAIMYRRSGAEKMLEAVRGHGLVSPADCFIFQMANVSHIKAYAPHPRQDMVVDYDWDSSPSLIHDGNWFFERGV